MQQMEKSNESSSRKNDIRLDIGSAFARLLYDMKSKKVEAEQLGDQLNKWVRGWHVQRLWSINLAPELVAHDELHAGSVESLLGNLIYAGYKANDKDYQLAFSPTELVVLSVAAWLHDWGHIGGPIPKPRVDETRQFDEAYSERFFNHPVFVRELHGLISQELLSRHWKGMHGINDSKIYWPASILCGHHQSWTSFSNHREVAFRDRDGMIDRAAYRSELSAQLYEGSKEYSAPSLHSDVEWMREGLHTELRKIGTRMNRNCFARMQFFLALLRVADAADMGLHRVPDRGDKRWSFLGRCLYREALIVHESLVRKRFERESTRHEADLENGIRRVAGIVSGARSLGSGTDEQAWLEVVRSFDEREEFAEVDHLKKYSRFLKAQGEYYNKHARVEWRGVEFKVRRFENRPVLAAVVDPAKSPEDRSGKIAGATVYNDIRKELLTVRDVLVRNGYKNLRVVYTNPYTNRKYGWWLMQKGELGSEIPV